MGEPALFHRQKRELLALLAAIFACGCSMSNLVPELCKLRHEAVVTKTVKSRDAETKVVPRRVSTMRLDRTP